MFIFAVVRDIPNNPQIKDSSSTYKKQQPFFNFQNETKGMEQQEKYILHEGNSFDIKIESALLGNRLIKLLLFRKHKDAS